MLPCDASRELVYILSSILTIMAIASEGLDACKGSHVRLSWKNQRASQQRSTQSMAHCQNMSKRVTLRDKRLTVPLRVPIILAIMSADHGNYIEFQRFLMTCQMLMPPLDQTGDRLLLIRKRFFSWLIRNTNTDPMAGGCFRAASNSMP